MYIHVGLYQIIINKRRVALFPLNAVCVKMRFLNEKNDREKFSTEPYMLLSKLTALRLNFKKKFLLVERECFLKRRNKMIQFYSNFCFHIRSFNKY